MLLVGLTGGIGAGKTTVGEMLQARGAVIVDADELARRAVEPGTPGLESLIDQFGREALRPDGSLDREALAEIVFADPEARRRLESIVHPEVARLLDESVEPHRATDRVVVYVVPLLVETGLEGTFDVIVTVEAPEDVRVARVMADRGMTEQDARRRAAAQASDRARTRLADVVLHNEGSVHDLERAVDELWKDLRQRAAMIGPR